MAETIQIHATAFIYRDQGCLVLGDAGSGKTSLAAQMLLHGAELIADDQVLLTQADGSLVAQAPATTQGVMELRGMGLIRLAYTRAPIHCVIQLQMDAVERLPEPETKRWLEVEVPMIRLQQGDHGAAARLALYLQAMQEGRNLSPEWRPESS